MAPMDTQGPVEAPTVLEQRLAAASEFELAKLRRGLRRRAREDRTVLGRRLAKSSGGRASAESSRGERVRSGTRKTNAVPGDEVPSGGRSHASELEERLARLQGGYLDPDCELLLLNRLLDLKLSFLYQRNTDILDRLSRYLDAEGRSMDASGAGMADWRFGTATLACDQLVRRALASSANRENELLRAMRATLHLVSWLKPLVDSIYDRTPPKLPESFASAMSGLVQDGESTNEVLLQEGKRDVLTFFCDWQEANEGFTGLEGKAADISTFHAFAFSRRGLAMKWIRDLGYEIDDREIRRYRDSLRAEGPQTMGMMVFDYAINWGRMSEDDNEVDYDEMDYSDPLYPFDETKILNIILNTGPYSDFLLPLASFERTRLAGEELQGNRRVRART